MLRYRLAETIATARAANGLSLREIARRAGVSPDTVQRTERGEPGAMTVNTLSRLGEALGFELAASFYPNGDPVRDKAHLGLLNRFRARLGPGIAVRVEVPIPIVGDLLSGDAVVACKGGDVLVEAETRLGDIQLIERKAAAKQRDLSASRLVLLVADTRHNRDVLRRHPELRGRFPVEMRSCVQRLARGEDPGGDSIVVL